MSKCPTCGTALSKPPKPKGTLRFRKGNRIKYMQDFTCHEGVPAGIDFRVERYRGSNKKTWDFTLTAPGYGDLTVPGRYGNGSLTVWGLSKRQRARFGRAARQAKEKP